MHEISQAYVKVSFGHVGGFHLGDFYVKQRGEKDGPIIFEYVGEGFLQKRLAKQHFDKLRKYYYWRKVESEVERECGH